jgi:hypothetical protein
MENKKGDGTDGGLSVTFKLVMNKPNNPELEKLRIGLGITDGDPYSYRVVQDTKCCACNNLFEYCAFLNDDRTICQMCFERYTKEKQLGSYVPYNHDSHCRIIEASVSIDHDNILSLKYTCLTVEEFLFVLRKSVMAKVHVAMASM